MELTIIGLPKSGKTTLFNGVTRGHADTSAFATGTEQPNLGIVKVPDPRLESLEALFKPKRTVSAEVQYVDLPGGTVQRGDQSAIAGETLNLLQRADALVEVVRAFDDLSVPHPEGTIDPERDIQAMDLELAFADLAILERRGQRLEASLKGAKSSERDQALKEHHLLARLKEKLEQEVPIRQQHLEAEEAKLLEGYQFLTAKPLLVVLNVGEEQASDTDTLAAQMAPQFDGPGRALTALCGKLEMELAQLEGEEEREFRASLGVEESALHRMVRLSYDVLGLIAFFSYASQEVRAWSVPKGTPAAQAAGKIHTDMERGFIRAEVVAYDDLMGLGSLAEARRHGRLRLEGRVYQVCDGDVITFLFNV